MALTVAGAWSYAGAVCPAAPIDPIRVADVVHQLVATERALRKLAARGISADEPPQLRHNRYVVLHNPRDPERRRFSSARRTAAAR
jgi:hypothetical protein